MPAEVTEAPKADKKQENPESLTRLAAGRFVQMIDERWFACSDAEINQRLNRHVTKAGLLLESVGYDHTEGVGDRDCKTFTLRQFYQDGRPTLDYTDQEVAGLLTGIERHIDHAARIKIERVLIPGIKEFEKHYKGLKADLEVKLALGSTT